MLDALGALSPNLYVGFYSLLDLSNPSLADNLDPPDSEKDKNTNICFY